MKALSMLTLVIFFTLKSYSCTDFLGTDQSLWVLGSALLTSISFEEKTIIIRNGDHRITYVSEECEPALHQDKLNSIKALNTLNEGCSIKFRYNDWNSQRKTCSCIYKNNTKIYRFFGATKGVFNCKNPLDD